MPVGEGLELVIHLVLAGATSLTCTTHRRRHPLEQLQIALAFADLELRVLDVPGQVGADVVKIRVAPLELGHRVHGVVLRNLLLHLFARHHVEDALEIFPDRQALRLRGDLRGEMRDMLRVAGINQIQAVPLAKIHHRSRGAVVMRELLEPCDRRRPRRDLVLDLGHRLGVGKNLAQHLARHRRVRRSVGLLVAGGHQLLEPREPAGVDLAVRRHHVDVELLGNGKLLLQRRLRKADPALLRSR